MKRTILFKGKRVDDSEWVEGSYILDGETHRIFEYNKKSLHDCGIYSGTHVDPDTVCQFTGLTDKNGNKIFEGDKFPHEDEDGSYYLIEYENDLSKFCVNVYSYSMSHGEGSQEIFDNEISHIDTNVEDLINFTDLEIIGNIHD